MNLSACKELAKNICQLSHEMLVQSLPTLWVRVVETVVNRLGNYIVELFEKLFFAFLIILGVFNECE
mgnify:CR=1 FL=1